MSILEKGIKLGVGVFGAGMLAAALHGADNQAQENPNRLPQGAVSGWSAQEVCEVADTVRNLPEGTLHHKQDGTPLSIAERNSLPTGQRAVYIPRNMVGSGEIYSHFDSGDACVIFTDADGNLVELSIQPPTPETNGATTQKPIRRVQKLENTGGQIEQDEDPEGENGDGGIAVALALPISGNSEVSTIPVITSAVGNTELTDLIAQIENIGEFSEGTNYFTVEYPETEGIVRNGTLFLVQEPGAADVFVLYTENEDGEPTFQEFLFPQTASFAAIKNEVIVPVGSANIRAGAGTSSEVVGRGPQDLTLRPEVEWQPDANDRSLLWLPVSYENNEGEIVYGWVRRDVVEEITIVPLETDEETESSSTIGTELGSQPPQDESISSPVEPSNREIIATPWQETELPANMTPFPQNIRDLGEDLGLRITYVAAFVVHSITSIDEDTIVLEMVGKTTSGQPALIRLEIDIMTYMNGEPTSIPELLSNIQPGERYSITFAAPISSTATNSVVDNICDINPDPNFCASIQRIQTNDSMTAAELEDSLRAHGNTNALGGVLDLTNSAFVLGLDN